MAGDRNGADRLSWGSPPWPLDRRAYSIRLRAHYPSTKEALNEAVTCLLGVAERSGCITDEKADLEIALREAVANAIIHGNALGNEKNIFVRCYAAPQIGLLIVVRDQGPGFNPVELPDPRDSDRKELHHGRGVFLMRELMDFVEYRKGGCEVILFKACRPGS